MKEEYFYSFFSREIYRQWVGEDLQWASLAILDSEIHSRGISRVPVLSEALF